LRPLIDKLQLPSKLCTDFILCRQPVATSETLTGEIMENTLEVGKKLVDLCRRNENVKAVESLYAPNIVSIEATATPVMEQRMEGIAKIKGKNEWWVKTHEVHSSEAIGPFPHGDRFIVYFKYDVTAKEGPMKGKRMKLEEAGLYTVKDGKIAKEEFFYAM